MLVKTEAIVLHSLKYGETRLIVDLFTREVGRLSCIIPLPKTPKARLKKQYFQPMTLLEIEVDVRQRLQLQKLKDARLLSAYASIPFSPEKLALSLFIASSCTMPCGLNSITNRCLRICATLCNGLILQTRAMPTSTLLS